MTIEEMKAAIDNTVVPSEPHDGDAAMLLAEIATENGVYDLDGYWYEEIMIYSYRRVLEVRS